MNGFGGIRNKHNDQRRPCYASMSIMALGILFGLEGMIDLLLELLINHRQIIAFIENCRSARVTS